MPRKGENIYKRKDGRWEGRYIGCYDENHKAKYVYIYGKTYTEVKQKLAIERGRQKQHVPAEKKQITYQKRRTLAEERHRKSRYSAYIADVEKTLITKRDRNVRVLNDYLSPSPEVLCSFLDNENNRLRLWVTVYFIVRPSSIFKICGSILHIVQTLVITVCNDCLALFLKLFQVVNNTATKKRVPIF